MWQILEDACWALCYFTDGTKDRLQAVINAGPRPAQPAIHRLSGGCLRPAGRQGGKAGTGREGGKVSLSGRESRPSLWGDATDGQAAQAV